MAGFVDVLLLEDIDTLGRAGDIVNVAEAYARNALFPSGKAALATKQVQSAKSAKDAAAKKRAEEELLAIQTIADRMENTELAIPMNVKEAQEIFGSVGPKDVAKLLKEESDISVTPSSIKGEFPIKSIGTYDVTVQLGQGVEFHMKVTITPMNNPDEHEEA